MVQASPQAHWATVPLPQVPISLGQFRAVLQSCPTKGPSSRQVLCNNHG